ncbi:MAG: diiron oxygenase [Polyangia bacterium]
MSEARALRGEVEKIANQPTDAPLRPSVSSLLEKINRSWSERAQVRRPLSDGAAFEPQRDDFIEALLPFCDHPIYRSYPDALKKRLLSCGWLIYNQKTIAIELEIIAPACVDMLRGGVPGRLDGTTGTVIAQTLVDESYHTLLSVNMCRLASVERQLSLTLPPFQLIRALDAESAGAADTTRRIARLAYAMVSELFISDYLQLLSESPTIQPIFRDSVAAHNRDELAHRALFPMLLQGISAELRDAELRAFVDAALSAISAFGDCEYAVWRAALAQVGAPDAARLTAESAERRASRVLSMDYSCLVDTFEELGLARHAYARERLEALLGNSTETFHGGEGT